MKTILIPITSNFFIRSFLRGDAFRILRDAPGIRLVFLAPEEKLDYYRNEFLGSRVVFDRLPQYRSYRVERFFKFIEIASIHTRTGAIMQYTDFLRTGSQARWPQRCMTFCIQRMLWHMGRFRWWRGAIRAAYAAIPSSIFSVALQKYNPDLVFVPTMLAPDMPMVKEAKARAIYTVGMVLSWDNLYSKTIARSHPDALLVHTDSIERQARTLGDYDAKRITVIGVPQYDAHFQKKRVLSRAEFMTSLGGDPSKKLIVYALSGKGGLEIEFDVLDILHESMARGDLGSDIQVLVRPYPRYDLPPEKIDLLKTRYGFLATPSMAHIGTGKDNWEFDEASLSLLANTLAHADIVITMYSTFFIEGAIWDKPLIGIAFDGRLPRNYWNSAARFFEWDHLAEIKTLNGVCLIKNREELVSAIHSCVRNPAHLQEGRRAIVAQQCQYTDGGSGERIASFLLKQVS